MLINNKLVVCFLVGIFCIGIVSSATVEYTPTTTTECSFGVCTKTLYSGIQNIIDDGEWKDIDKMASLKDKGIFEIKIIEDDKNYPMTVLDYNTTSITIDLEQWSLFNEEVDLRIWKKNNTKYLDYLSLKEDPDDQGEDYDVDYKDYYDEVLSDKVIFNIFDLGNKVSVYNFKPGDVIEFGPNSTTIILDTPDTETLEDTWVNEGNPDYTLYGTGAQAWLGQYNNDKRQVATKFDISSLNGVNVINANHTINIELNNLDADESYYFGAYHVYMSYNWVESGAGVMTWNTRPQGANINASADSLTTVPGVQTGVIVWDITNMAHTSALNNDANLTIYIADEGGIGIDAIEQMLVSAKESATAGWRPKMEVTYSEDTCDYGSGNWEVNCADNCSISSDVDLSGNDIAIDGAGTFTITGANITNFGNGLVTGENTTDQCVVRCLDGGCLTF